jgi:hypothetical protein
MEGMRMHGDAAGKVWRIRHCGNKLQQTALNKSAERKEREDSDEIMKDEMKHSTTSVLGVVTTFLQEKQTFSGEFPPVAEQLLLAKLGIVIAHLVGIAVLP